jgi:hypothetical protein
MLDHPGQQYRRPDSVPRTEPKHVETGAEARQGSLGRQVFYVLIAGLVLAGLFLLGTQIWSVSEPLPGEGVIGDEISGGPVEPAPELAPPVGEAPAAPPPADIVPPPAEAVPPPAGGPNPAPAPAAN